MKLLIFFSLFCLLIFSCNDGSLNGENYSQKITKSQVKKVGSLQEGLDTLSHIEQAQRLQEYYINYKARWEVLVRQFKEKNWELVHSDFYGEVNFHDLEMLKAATVFVESYKDELLSNLRKFHGKKPTLKIGNNNYFRNDYDYKYPYIVIDVRNEIAASLDYINKCQQEIIWGPGYCRLIDSLRITLVANGWNFNKECALDNKKLLDFYSKLLASGRESPTDLPLRVGNKFLITTNYVMIDFKASVDEIFYYFNQSNGDGEGNLKNKDKARLIIMQAKADSLKKESEKKKIRYEYYNWMKHLKKYGWIIINESWDKKNVNNFLKFCEPYLINVSHLGVVELVLGNRIDYSLSPVTRVYLKDKSKESKDLIMFIVSLLRYGHNEDEITRGLLKSLKNKGWNLKLKDFYPSQKAVIEFLFALEKSGLVVNTGNVAVLVSDKFEILPGIVKIDCRQTPKQVYEYLTN